jgi:hypothetical protein
MQFVYCTGGWHASTENTNKVERYDVQSNMWEFKASMCERRYRPGMYDSLLTLMEVRTQNLSRWKSVWQLSAWMFLVLNPSYLMPCSLIDMYWCRKLRSPPLGYKSLECLYLSTTPQHLIPEYLSYSSSREPYISQGMDSSPARCIWFHMNSLKIYDW